MKTFYSILFVIFIFCAYLIYPSGPTSEDSQYTINVFSEEEVDSSTLRQTTLQKAAETAKSHGFSYFIIESEEDILILKTTPQEDDPTNLYYELIQSGNFTKRSVEPNVPSEGKLYSGYRMVIVGMKSKSGDAINVCSFTSCP